MSESKKVIPSDKSLGIYFLFDDARSKVYVGQTRKGIERIETHNKEKDFWSTAIMFLAENKKWKSLIDELELFATIKAEEGKRFHLENKVKAKLEFDEKMSALEKIFVDIEFYLSVLDYSLVKDSGLGQVTKENRIQVFAKRGGIYAKGLYNPEDNSIVVQKDSEIRMQIPANGRDTEIMRQTYLQKKWIYERNDKFFLKKDVSFSTLSPAAEFVIGGSCNGKTEWKDADGKTLKDLFKL